MTPEKQKLEILKLLYLDQRFLILDEPTSVLTPGEADERPDLVSEGIARAYGRTDFDLHRLGEIALRRHRERKAPLIPSD